MCGRQTSSPPEMKPALEDFCAPTLLGSALSFRDGAFSDRGAMFADAITLTEMVTRNAVTKTAMVRSLPIVAVPRLPKYCPDRSYLEV